MMMVIWQVIQNLKLRLKILNVKMQKWVCKAKLMKWHLELTIGWLWSNRKMIWIKLFKS